MSIHLVGHKRAGQSSLRSSLLTNIAAEAARACQMTTLHAADTTGGDADTALLVATPHYIRRGEMSDGHAHARHEPAMPSPS